MKFSRLLQTTALGLALAGLGLAQAPAAARGRMGMMARRGGALGGARQLLLFGYLGLSDAQKTHAQNIFDNAKAAAQPIRDQLKQARTNLRAAIEAGKPVGDLAAAEGALTGKLIAIRANAQVQFRAILTPDQLNKLDQLKTRRASPAATSSR